MYDRISDFYEGKSIFLTGASGFLGSVLLEILLRCLPGIKHVYVLLRQKKGKTIEERKNLIFRKKIFTKLLKKSPEITDKVKVVCGDIFLPGLGISNEDLQTITQEVSIVIHCAALLTFKLPYKVSIQANVLGTRSVIELCRKLKKCEVLIYTSTVFSNAQLKHKIIEEKIYGLPFSLESVLEDLESKEDEWFEKFLSKYDIKWPNSYTFSKCLAENMLNEEAKDLSVAIIRPSIVFGALKGPEPGYLETGFGSIDMPLAMGTGLVSVMLGSKVTFHLIPVDIVANTLVAASWTLANNRCSSPLIVNSDSGNVWNLKAPEYITPFLHLFTKNVLPNSFRLPTFTLFENKFVYLALRLYKDYLPCLVLDGVAYFKGSKLRLVPIQKQIDTLMFTLTYFVTNNHIIKTGEANKVTELLHPEDAEIFCTDLSGSKFTDAFNNLTNSSNLFNWNKDKLSPKSRKHFVFMNTMLTTFIKRFFLLLFSIFMYFTIRKMFL